MQQADGCDGDGGDVVAKGPVQVLDNLGERRFRQPDGFDHLGQFAGDKGDIGRLDGDISAGTDGDADIGLKNPEIAKLFTQRARFLMVREGYL